jgi:hypothetical protein
MMMALLRLEFFTNSGRSAWKKKIITHADSQDFRGKRMRRKNNNLLLSSSQVFASGK